MGDVDGVMLDGQQWHLELEFGLVFCELETEFGFEIDFENVPESDRLSQQGCKVWSGVALQSEKTCTF